MPINLSGRPFLRKPKMARWAPLSAAIREAETVLETMRAEPNPLAVHIFFSRRQYRNMLDSKSCNRRDLAARLNFDPLCKLGFRGNLEEWVRFFSSAIFLVLPQMKTRSRG